MDIQGNMKIFAISDLHLSGAEPKPMNTFGSNWENHWDKISCAWREKVGKDDIVLIAGDISWAMQWENAVVDLNSIGRIARSEDYDKGESRVLVELCFKAESLFAKRNVCCSK